MDDCLFCKISKGEVLSEKVYEDDNFFAFLDISPVASGHTLVIPKKHSRNIFDIESLEFGEMATVIKKIATVVKVATGADGINVHMNNEPEAGQVIFHTHVHVIPRFLNDNLKMWHGEMEDEKISKEIGEKIKKELLT